MLTAAAVLAAYPIIDGHNDLAYALRIAVDYDLNRIDLSRRQTEVRTDLVRLAEGGVGGQFWSLYVPSNWPGDRAVEATLEQVAFVHRLVATYPDRLALALSADDIDAAQSGGRIASLMGAEGGHSIGNSLSSLRALYALGVRYMTLTHNDNVPWADSATDIEVIGGLNDFGREVVAEMNHLGMMVDLSHVSPATMRDGFATSTAPIIFSHSCARAIVDHVRNVPDDMLGQLPANGGICMVAFVPQFVSAACYEWDEAVLDTLDAGGGDRRDYHQHMAAVVRRSATDPPPVATVAQVADHIEHVRAVAGIAHVGLGSDFDGCDPMPAGLEDVAGYPNLINELIERGWSEADLGALTRGNILRVMRDVEEVAGR